jgi:hypothetical protein
MVMIFEAEGEDKITKLRMKSLAMGNTCIYLQWRESEKFLPEKLG